MLVLEFFCRIIYKNYKIKQMYMNASCVKDKIIALLKGKPIFKTTI